MAKQQKLILQATIVPCEFAVGAYIHNEGDLTRKYTIKPYISVKDSNNLNAVVKGAKKIKADNLAVIGDGIIKIFTDYGFTTGSWLTTAADARVHGSAVNYNHYNKTPLLRMPSAWVVDITKWVEGVENPFTNENWFKPQYDILNNVFGGSN